MSQEVIEYMPPGSLLVAPQVRKRICLEEEKGLMQSIREVGLLQPIRVKLVENKPQIVDGHRRVSAVLKLGMAAIPVIVEQTVLSDSETKQRQLIANVQRSDLSPLEKASAISELILSEKLSAAQAATKLGMSSSSVSRLLTLLELPEDIRDQVSSGKIPVSAAYELAMITDATKRSELAEQVANGALTRDALTAARKTPSKQHATSVETKPRKVTAILDSQRSIAVMAVNLTLEGFIESLEEMLAKARKVRTQGLELTTFIKMLADQAKLAS